VSSLFHHCDNRPPNSHNWTETSETMGQNKPFLLLSWLSQGFCHSDRQFLLWLFLFSRDLLTSASLVITSILSEFITLLFCLWLDDLRYWKPAKCNSCIPCNDGSVPTGEQRAIGRQVFIPNPAPVARSSPSRGLIITFSNPP
jgi:hypothetical protein